MTLRNIVLISVDAMGARLVGAPTPLHASPTPVMDRMAAAGVTFTRAFAVAYPTQFAMPGPIGMRLPLDEGGYHLGLARSDGETLAERLKRRGYRTAGVTTDFYTSRCYGYARGFDDYVEFQDFAWHANGVARNDVDHLAARVRAGTYPEDVATRALAEKLGAFYEGCAHYARDRSNRLAAGARPWPQIDNWRFDEIAASMEEALGRWRQDPCGHARAILAGTPFIGNALAGLRIAPHYPDAEAPFADARELVRTMSCSDEPFFLWVHLTDVHGNITPDLAGMRPTSDLDRRFRANLDEVTPFGRRDQDWPGQAERADPRTLAHTDRAIGDFLAFLGSEGLCERTVVALTADHGTHAPERWFYGAHHGVSDHLNFWEELLHVPLVVTGPGIEPGAVHELVSTLDVGSILEAAADRDRLGPEAASQALARRFGRDHVIAEHALPGTCLPQFKPIKICVRDERRKIVYLDTPGRDWGESHVIHAFDLVADPHETRNLHAICERDPGFRRLIDIARDRAAHLRENRR
ncbi:sulfatase-like hydrolase/transferase [Salinarimonas sp.]|uniref:sulfatase-like hydrolase/transferase n=1 Tax=Salinarimonas sp. TaxID=2766526 RepID=UPI00391AB2C6